MIYYGTYRYVIMASKSLEKWKIYTSELKLEERKPAGSNTGAKKPDCF